MSYFVRASIVGLAISLCVPAASVGADCAAIIRSGNDALSKNYGRLAVSFFKKAVAQCPTNAQALRGMGLAYKMNGDMGEAKPFLEKALAASADDVALLTELGELLTWQQTSRQQGLSMLSKATELAPQSFKPRLLLGLAQSWSAETRSAAIENLRKASELKPTDLSARFALAMALAWSEQRTEAIALLKGIHAAHENFISLQHDGERGGTHIKAALAQVLTWEKHFDEASELLTRLQQKQPNNVIAKEVAAELSKLQNADADAKVAEAAAMTVEAERKYLEEGKRLSWDPRTREQSLKYFETHLLRHPGDIDTKRYLAEVSSWLGRRKAALELYDSILRDKPADVDTLTKRAQLKSWMGDFKNAVRQYRQVLATEPNNREALLGLGQVMNWSGDNLSASNMLDKAAKLYPTDAEIALEQAINFRALGRVDLALEYVKKSLTLFDAQQEPGGVHGAS